MLISFFQALGDLVDDRADAHQRQRFPRDPDRGERNERWRHPPSAAIRPRYPWVLIGLLWVVAFLNAADRNILVAVLPDLEREFGLTEHAARVARLGVLLDLRGRRLHRRADRRQRAAHAG